MAGEIKIVRAIPGSTHLGPILRDFSRSEGTITSFSDPLLFNVRKVVEDDWPVEVEPFGKVVREYLSLCGEPALLIAPGGHTLATIAHACAGLSEESPFYRSAKFPGTHQAISHTLDELADYGIGSDELASLSESTSGRISEKLASLAFVSRESERVLSLLGRQLSSQHVRQCLEAIPERDGMMERLLILAGSEIPPMKRQWIRWAAKHGTQITVVLDRHATEAGLFPSADQAALALGSPGTVIGEGNQLINNLFSDAQHGGAPVDVSVVSTADPLAEAEWAVRGCLEHASSAIYARNLESYAPLIEAAAERLGLPVQVYRRAALLSNAFARLTLCVLEFCAGSDVRKLEPVLRSSYLGLEPEQRRALSGTLREAHRAKAGAWDQLEAFSLSHAEMYPWLAHLLDWRRRAGAMPHTLREWLPLLGELIRADEKLPWSTATLQANVEMRERDIRARNRMETVIGDSFSVQNLTSDRLLNLQEVVRACRYLWEESDVSIPTAGEGVTVTNSAEMIGGVSHLFVLGMLEGVFPRRRSEDPVLTDQERRQLGELVGVDLPDSHDKSRAERDEFYRVCAAAGNKVVFSYPKADDQRDNIPAYYLKEVQRAASGRFSEIDYPRPLLSPAIDSCTSEADKRLRMALDGPKEFALPNVIQIPSTTDAYRPALDEALTPGEIRDAYQCSFQYVFRHRLKLRSRQQARWNSLRSIPQKGDLVVQPDSDAAIRALHEVLESELDLLYGELSDWEIQLLRSGGKRLINEWVRREFKARVKWPKENVQRHGSFGSELKGSMPGGVELRGSVPAVSTLATYKVAHLYGSNSPESSELEPTDRLYYGLHLLGLHGSAPELALELESMAGKRVLLVLGRAAGVFLPGEQREGLRVIDLAEHDDGTMAKKLFFEEVKSLLKESVQNIRQGEIAAKPGEHCTWCDYGELCRRSRVFSDDDSPFGLDTVAYDE